MLFRSFEEAKAILQAKNIFHEMPISVQKVINQGVEGALEETPKSQMPNIKHYLLASNVLALNAAAQSAQKNGLSTKIVKEAMQGDVSEMIQKMLEILENSQEECILFGGECTVRVSGNGQGGRNQHAVALMLEQICKRGLKISFLSAGTDGIDGNSDASGGVVSDEDCVKIEDKALSSYIKNFDSYNCLKELDSLIVTGPSGTNVIDIAIIIKGE